MDFAFFVPITFFVCVTLAIKYIIDGRVRRRLAETNASEDLVKSILLADEQARRLSALKWGIVLSAVGIAFGLIGGLHLDTENPAIAGLLIGSAGIGMLIYHFVASKSR